MKLRMGLPFQRDFSWVLQVRVASGGVDTVSEFPYRVRNIDRGVDCREVPFFSPVG